PSATALVQDAFGSDNVVSVAGGAGSGVLAMREICGASVLDCTGPGGTIMVDTVRCWTCAADFAGAVGVVEARSAGGSPAPIRASSDTSPSRPVITSTTGT